MKKIVIFTVNYLILILMFGIISCVGGGGDAAVPATAPSRYSISGTISGEGTIGVMINLSGSATASTTTNASGTYTFSDLSSGTYTITLSKEGFTYAPVSISLEIDNANLAGLNFVGSLTNYESTELISIYMDIQHSQQIINFINDEKALGNKLAAEGAYFSGRHYTESRQDYISHIQSFLDLITTYVQQVDQTMPIDKAAIEQLLIDYRDSDYSYATTYYSNVNWGLSGSGLTAFIIETNLEIRDIYAATALQIAAL